MIRIAGPRPKPPTVFYVCNGKKCPTCRWNEPDECHHTTDLDYARYEDHPEGSFDIRPHPDFGSQMWERIRRGKELA